MHLAERPAAAGEEAAQRDGAADAGSRFECPATQLPCERAPFAALPDCGHALSERAIRQACDAWECRVKGLGFRAEENAGGVVHNLLEDCRLRVSSVAAGWQPAAVPCKHCTMSLWRICV